MVRWLPEVRWLGDVVLVPTTFPQYQPPTQPPAGQYDCSFCLNVANALAGKDAYEKCPTMPGVDPAACAQYFTDLYRFQNCGGKCPGLLEPAKPVGWPTSTPPVTTTTPSSSGSSTGKILLIVGAGVAVVALVAALS